jgi:hypothetical protein
LTASLDGFKTQTVDNLRVTIDNVASVTFRMQPDSFAGEITVTGEVPLIELTSSSTSTNFDAEFVEDLPTRGNFYDIMSVAPAMSAPSEGSNSFSGYGGNVTSQQWNIDGLNMAAPEGGWLSWDLNPEVIAETQLTGTGAGAQYGNTLGNVYNVVTKSGTNQLKGSLSFLFQHDSLTSTNKKLSADEIPDYRLNDPVGQFTRDHFYDYRGTLGGPIAEDKVWFFAAAQYRDTAALGPFQTDQFGSGTITQRYDLKITSQLTDGQRLELRGHRQDSEFLPAPDMFSELSTVTKTNMQTEMVTVDYTSILTDRDFLTVRGGVWSSGRDMESRTGSTDWWYLDDVYGGPALNFGGVFWFKGREEDYQQADVVLSHYADDFLGGEHDFKYGVQYTKGEARRTVGSPGFMWRQPAGGPFSYWYPMYTFLWQVEGAEPFVYGADVESFSAFFDDSWKVSNSLTIDAGLRFDRQQGRIPSLPRLDQDSQPTGEVFPGIDMIDWKNFAPRLGFAWQPKDDGKTVVRGFVGLFWDGPVSSAWYYPPPGRRPLELWWADPQWGQIYSQPTPAAEDLLDPDVDNPHTWQYSLAIDQQLGNDCAIGLQLVKKATKDMIGWEIMDDGVFEPFTYTDWMTGETLTLVDTIGQPTRRKGNGPGPGSLAPDESYHIDYQGAILTFRKRYTDGWSMMASYTYSKTEGINPRPHGNGSLGQGLPGFTTDSGSDPNDWANAKHLLQGDRKHMFRVQTNVDLPWDLRASAILNIQSGRPYSRLAQVVAPSGGALTVTVAPASDAQRMPSQTIFDIGLSKSFSILNGEVTFGVQILNLFNEDAAEYWSTWTLYEGDEFVASNWVTPRRAQLRLKFAY